MKKLFCFTLLACLITCAMLPAAQAESTMYVYTENRGSLNVRSSERVENNVVGRLDYGAAVSVITTYNGWALIRYSWTSGGYTSEFAYVQSRYLVKDKPGGRTVPTPVPSSSAEKTLSEMNAQFKSGYKVTPYTVIARPSRASGWVNLRWAPTTESERITTCPQGKELLVLAELQNWFQVQDPATGMIGFISRQYVSVR